MSKIYIKTVRKKQTRRYIVLAGLMLILVGMYAEFSIRIRPIMSSVASNYAENAGARAIDIAISEKMRSENIKYEDIIKIIYDAEGRVSAISADVMTINRLKSDMSKEIGEKISNLDMIDASIPLGNLLGNEFLSGLGPKIRIRLVPLASSSINMYDEFRDAGINQTLHTVYLKVLAYVRVLPPIAGSTVTIETSVAIAQTVIVGVTPNTYTNITGVKEENPADIALNIE